MIIGRTAENKIKIKTDDPLGLRAVECACCNPCEGPISGQNVFEITKEEYLKYKNGGTWTLNASIFLSDVTSEPSDAGIVYGYINEGTITDFTFNTFGCQNLFVDAPSLGTGTLVVKVSHSPDEVYPFYVGAGFSYLLGQDYENDKFFVLFRASLFTSTGIIFRSTYTSAEYPEDQPNLNMSVDGNNLIAYQGGPLPYWLTDDPNGPALYRHLCIYDPPYSCDGHTFNSLVTMTATFTPNE